MSLTPTGDNLPTEAGLPFEGLQAPTPIRSTPPAPARWLAFGSIIVGGLLGGLIGYGTGDLLGNSSLWGAIGGLVGAVFCAAGVGIVATLTLRAMNEWNAVHHPEADLPTGLISEQAISEQTVSEQAVSEQTISEQTIREQP